MRISGLAAAALGCTLLGLFSGILCWTWLAHFGAATDLVAGLLCAGPALAAVSLALTSRSDRQQYLARLLAAAALLPILLMMWVLTEDSPASQGLVAGSVFGFIVLHGASFAALVWQLAPLTARIDACSTTPVSAQLLGQRLQSLVAGGLPWRLARGQVSHQWVLDSRAADDQSRFHRVLLNIDPLRCEVQVRGRLGASGAAPQDADKASLRGPGGDAIDAARPNAQRGWSRGWSRVWSRRLQATIVDGDRLAATRLDIMAGHAQAETGAAADAQSLLTLLAALVTRSGYAWQPAMLLRRSRRPGRPRSPRPQQPQRVGH